MILPRNIDLFKRKFLLSFESYLLTSCTFQRLEFLGDSVLDLLITRYLYETYKDIDPGELTDLRSASVSNENFAQTAVRRDLQPHLQHCSRLLLSQITEYVKSFSEPNNTPTSVQGAKGPKASFFSFFFPCIYVCIYVYIFFCLQFSYQKHC